MAYDLQEQESIDQMKAWWDRWGTPVTAAVCVVCLGFAGWNGWNWYKRNQAAEASVAYVQLQNAVFHKDVKNVASLTSGLIENYGGTVYAPLAAFGAAQTALEAGNFAEAAAMLNWVIEKSGHPEYDTVARVRLAGVYFDEGKLDDALKVLEAAKPTDAERSLVNDRLADVWRAKGDVAKARALWEELLKTADPSSVRFRPQPDRRTRAKRPGFCVFSPFEVFRARAFC